MKYLIKSNDYQEVLDDINNGQNNYRPIVISTQNNDTQFGEDDNVIFLPKRFVEFNHKITQEKIDEFQQYVSENKINETIDVYELTSNGYIYDSFIVNEVEMAQPLSEIIETEYGPTNIEGKHESIVLDFDTSLPLVTDGEIIGVFDETLTTDKPYMSICLKMDNMCRVMIQDTIDTFQNIENAPSLILNGNTLTLEKDFALKLFNMMESGITIEIIEQYGYSLSLIFSNEAVNVDSQDDSKETLKSIYGDKLLNLTIDYDYSSIDYSQITFNDKNINYCKDFSITFERPLVDDDYLILLGETIKISNNDLTYMWETKDNQTIYPSLYFVETLIKSYNMDYMKIYDENGNQIKYKISYRTGGTPENISVPLQPSEINVVAQISSNLYKKHKKSLVGSLMKWEYIDDYTGYITSPTLAHRYALRGSGESLLINTSFCIDTIKLPNDVTFIPDDFCANTTIRKVIIPNSVTTIGNLAFSDCTSLTSVTIPSSVTEIGNQAFVSCMFQRDKLVNNSSLTSSNNWGAKLYDILQDDGLCINGTTAVDCRPNATNVTIPSSVTSISSSAFTNCTNLISVTIPSSVTSIDSTAFNGYYFQHDKFINNSNSSGYPWGAKLYDIVQDDGLCINGTTVVDCRPNATNVTVPSSVTSIGTSAFSGCTNLTSVTIGSGVTSIEYGAFYSCTRLSSVTIPDSVTSIGDSAFYNCTRLSSVTIPDSVAYIGSNAFYYTPFDNNLPNGDVYLGSCYYKYKGTMPSNTSIIIKDGTKSISNYAFFNCSGLTDITIPDSVTSIEYGAFHGCTSLKSVIIPDSVTTIDTYAFFNCTSLTSVTIPDSVTTIGTYAFFNCSGLTSVTISNSVTSISSSTFENCSNLTSVTIPSSVTSISNSAFENCSGLTSIEIPNSVTEIGYEAFSGCTSLTSIEIPDSVTSIGQSAFTKCTSLTSIVIPNSVTKIGYSVFRDCTSLTSVTIPDSVTSIDSSAFEGTPFYNNLPNGEIYLGSCYYKYKGTMPNNTSITIKDGTKSISSLAFASCSGLTDITIPDSVTSIEYGAFYGCTSLKSVIIPSSVTTIENQVFENCASLTSVTISNSVTSISSRTFASCIRLKSIEIPDSVTSIGSDTFRNCMILTSVTIPDSVTEIGGGAFYGCSSLTSIVIPDNITSIYTNTFSNCDSLTSVTIPDSVTSIGDDAFYNCDSLTSIEIPSSVTSIGRSAFQYCDSLTSVTIPDSVTSIGQSAFTKCTSLISIVIPDSVTYIGSDVFYNCSGLTLVTISNSITSIYTNTFRDCKNLTSVIIPDSVTSIGNDAFRNCTSLNSITCLATTAPTLGNSYVFYSLQTNGKLYVPSGSDYSSWLSKLPSGWSIEYI